MKLIAFILTAFVAHPCFANAELKFTDTRVTVDSKSIVFRAVPSANSFVHNETDLKIVITRISPDIPVNEKTVKRTWNENLATVGLKPGLSDCKEASRFLFQCSYKDKNQTIVLSYSRKDLITGILTGNKAANTKIKFAKIGK